MSTTTRRQFLTRALAVLGAAPLLTCAAKLEPQYHIGMDLAGPGSDAMDHYAEHVVRVEGLAVKVPSNRWRRCVDDIAIEGQPLRTVVEYVGDWDGTFKLERGCTNPAYILAHLSEWPLVDHDWVLHVKKVSLDAGGVRWGVSQLTWQMLYDWGVWADQQSEDWTCISDHGWHTEHSSDVSVRSRFEVHAAIMEPHDVVQLRETLRMHCLLWQSQDSRYRTSWPGTPSQQETPHA